MKAFIVHAFFVFVVAVLTACGGGGSGGGGGTPAPTPVLPNFQSIQDNVFSVSCAVSGCHFGANAPEGLQLSAGNSYGLLVNVDSAEVSTLKRVQPFNPNDSYLIRKLEGGPGIQGVQMPNGRPPLPQNTINAIRQWITDGALLNNNPTPTPTTTPEPTPTPQYARAGLSLLDVVVTSPAHGSVFQSLPRQFVIVFNQELNANTVYADYFELLASGQDGHFDNGNERKMIPHSTTMPYPNANTVLLDFSHINSGADIYQLSISPVGGTAIQDLFDNQLDRTITILFAVK